MNRAGFGSQVSEIISNRFLVTVYRRNAILRGPLGQDRSDITPFLSLSFVFLVIFVVNQDRI